MAAPVLPAVAFNDLMTDDASFLTILERFGLSARARERFAEDFPNGQSLLLASESEVKSIVTNQNKIFRTHATNNQRCYITATQQNRITAFHRWAIFAIKDANATYGVATLGEFTREWIDSIRESYNSNDPEETSQSTALSVEVPKFTGTNWFDVRSKIRDLLTTRIGSAGIPLTYLIRAVRRTWEDTEEIQSLQDRRIVTKVHQGTSFERDNREFHRILTNLFSGSTLEGIVQSNQARTNGIKTWKEITDNVQGANYSSDLKRSADRIISSAFFDPEKMFSFEQYFEKHVRAHAIFAEAGAPLAEWKKIEDFMKGIKCTHLQNDYRQVKDLPQYATFTSFYNKINENYRTLIDQKIIRPASVMKRKISQVDTTHVEQFSFRGGGRRGGRGRGRGRYGGRGRGRGGRGRGGRHFTPSGNSIVSALPQDIDVNGSLHFSGEQWRSFTPEQKSAIQSLRQYRQQSRQVAAMQAEFGQQPFRQLAAIQSGPGQQQQINQNNQGILALPPPPDNQAISRPGASSSTSSSVTFSSQAGRAFGRGH
jgi:hypothetical protein